MKILYLNGADHEGGAAKAATRLLEGIRNLGVDARFQVQRKTGTDPLITGPASPGGKLSARLRPTVEQLFAGINPRKIKGPFCTATLPDRLTTQVAATAPDLVHLHWVARMMRLETLARFKVPIVWTLHDSWPFTGGCYLPGDCTRYRENCGRCPILMSSSEEDLSRRVWSRKHQSWQRLNLALVAPSNWMAECAKASSLFCHARVDVIPNGIDTELFTPVDRIKAREALSLPLDRTLVLFGAAKGNNDPNKGTRLLAEALRHLTANSGHCDMELVLFGSAETPAGFNHMKVHNLGWQEDEARLARIYAAADVFVFPSVQETLGYAAMEAMACGTPCVSFRQGGVPDLIDHEVNGYLARPFDPADLAQGITWVLRGEARYRELSRQARLKIEREFALERIASRHLALYQELVDI